MSKYDNYLDRHRWLYLGGALAGWALSARMVITALYRGMVNRRPGAGLIIHSDRGVRYAGKDSRKILKNAILFKA